MPNNNLLIKKNFKNIFGMISGFFGVWIIHIGIETGLLKKLYEARSFLSFEQIKKSFSYNDNFLRTWLKSAVEHDIIMSHRTKGFSISKNIGSILFDKTNRFYCGPIIQLCASLSNQLETIPKSLNSAAPISNAGQNLNTLRLMSEITQLDFPYILNNVLLEYPNLKNKLNNGASVLDIGCGFANASVFMAHIFPKSNFFCIDKNRRSIRMAKQIIKDHNLSKRIKCTVKNAACLNLKEKYDLIFLNLFLHEINNDKILESFLKKCYSWLNDGGDIFINEFPSFDKMDKNKDPATKVILGFQLPDVLQGANFISKNKLTSLIRSSGFKKITYIKQPNPARVFVLSKK